MSNSPDLASQIAALTTPINPITAECDPNGFTGRAYRVSIRGSDNSGKIGLQLKRWPITAYTSRIVVKFADGTTGDYIDNPSVITRVDISEYCRQLPVPASCANTQPGVCEEMPTVRFEQGLVVQYQDGDRVRIEVIDDVGFPLPDKGYGLRMYGGALIWTNETVVLPYLDSKYNAQYIRIGDQRSALPANSQPYQVVKIDHEYVHTHVERQLTIVGWLTNFK